MAFTITNSSGATVLTAATPISIAAGIYYLKRCKADSAIRKVTVDTSPSAKGSFAQDFDDCCWPISGGSLMLCDTTEAAIRASFKAYSDLIKQQIGLTLSIPDESTSFPNCVCTAFELMRKPPPDLRMFIPTGNGTTLRAYVAMEFVQLAK